LNAPIKPSRVVVVKKYLFAGLLIWVPIAVTFWVIQMVIGMMDQTLNFLPEHLRPINRFGFHIPGLGALITLIIIFVTGVIAANIFGQQLVRWWDQLLNRIPVVNSVYKAVKQVSDTLLKPEGTAFRKVLLVRYPHPEAWSLAFQTSVPAEAARRIGDDHVAVFIPTTPSPVNGFYFFIRKSETIELDMTVDVALRTIVSMGVVAAPEVPAEASPNVPAGRAQNE
jgi:uncharacterized membrane protein